ncbi:hypothetical protein JH06_5395 [Blastocystis sp. subtype 4]|uniref:hypothetical protein n=1 Tax=Blastocystis sp. subtype 4 TaxID=944170 RepID=UPI0007122A45|nr:hypothetical protein JH06_5395 [Blastocystis sp. subtype 4]KNB42341.1 hypothetical protein JH06_5395 [Blastocystis sp. subtype 4]|eukprot:XP_014525784.1 hypothetical protein JH06_5395 [Blastocystis sp. subtype 4]
MACMAVANIVKSSLGPVGLDKMLVDKVGDVTITNDGATILQKLEVEHPAAKVLVQLADLQDKEVGDGTTSVVIFAAELLKNGLDLIRLSVHPTLIMSGYRLALKECIRYIRENLLISSSLITDEVLFNVAKTTLSSKILGAETEKFSQMAVEAVERIRNEDIDGKVKYPIENIGIIKAHGQSALESELVDGLVLSGNRASQQMPLRIKDAKVIVIDFALQRYKTQMGVEVKVSDPDKLEEIKREEMEITRKQVERVLATGANVVVCGHAIDDLCLKYLVEAGCIGIRRVNNDDLIRVSKATGATIVVNMSDFEGNDTLDSSVLGHCECVEEKRLGDYDFIYFEGLHTTNDRSVSVVLRGANDMMLQEMERSFHDAVCVEQRVMESKSLVVGGGAVETALYLRLQDYAMSLSTSEQLAVQAFGKALLIIPKTLAVNAAKDATELIAQLCARHANQEDPEACYYGLDLVAGAVVNNFKKGVLEPTMNKVKCLKFATEAAITILRIDDMIKINPPPEQDPGNSTPRIM